MKTCSSDLPPRGYLTTVTRTLNNVLIISSDSVSRLYSIANRYHQLTTIYRSMLGGVYLSLIAIGDDCVAEVSPASLPRRPPPPSAPAPPRRLRRRPPPLPTLTKLAVAPPTPSRPRRHHRPPGLLPCPAGGTPAPPRPPPAEPSPPPVLHRPRPPLLRPPAIESSGNSKP